jgi:hypothetical protein
MEHYASMIASLRTLMESNQPVDEPLERLGFLGNERIRRDVVKQRVEKERLDGREWLDFHLTVMGQEDRIASPIQSQVLFRVDPDTRLLRLSRYKYEWEGTPIVSEWHFDYPTKGPDDVYDVGAPKTAKIVDRVPANDLRQILEALRAGRRRMDDYRAVIVRRTEGIWRPSGYPEVIYRKGDKFRRDTAIWIDPSDLTDPNIKWPKGDNDAGNWWRRCVEERCFLLPMSIDRGSTAYTIDRRSITDPDGSVHYEITGVEKRESASMPGEMYPGLWSWMPEFACRPPLGMPSKAMEPILELDPKEGPAGTILLRVRRVGRKPRRLANPAGELPPPAPDAYHYWIDPARGYVIVRHDMIGDFGDSGKEEVHSTIIEEMAKSPQGTWYATRIRRRVTDGDSNKRTDDEIIDDLYVDFNVNLPDSLFEPPPPGRIR